MSRKAASAALMDRLAHLIASTALFNNPTHFSAAKVGHHCQGFFETMPARNELYSARMEGGGCAPDWRAQEGDWQRTIRAWFNARIR